LLELGMAALDVRSHAVSGQPGVRVLSAVD
ncbi:MAG: hypothetical protein QOD24_2187, partial [Solirubrobacteraceae bacterium]|nr:hypothetical protein [Solirubrobacteraceae bacterium]